MRVWRLFELLAAMVLAAGCASYSGRELQPGLASLEDVLATMGTPTLRWNMAGGGVQLSYPRGPEGMHSFMAWIGRDGRLERIENVLVPEYFDRIRAGMLPDEVLQVLGPPVPHWTTFFPVRQERVWEWRICDRFNPARFVVLMDAESQRVRGTFIYHDIQGPEGEPLCTL